MKEESFLIFATGFQISVEVMTSKMRTKLKDTVWAQLLLFTWNSMTPTPALDPYAGSFLTLNTYEATYDEDDDYRYLSDTWIGGSYQSGDNTETSGYLIKVNDFFEFEWGV